MPRKSAAELLTVPVDIGRRSRLVPPPFLSEEEATEFCALVGAVDARHFNRADVALLSAYVQAICGHRAAAAALAREGAVAGGRPSAWSAVQERHVKAMVVLARALRLAPSARMNSRQASRNARDESPRGIDALFGGGRGDDEA